MSNSAPATRKTPRHWTLDDIPWDRFQADKVDPDVLRIVKAAALVEFNGRDYAIYLCNVIPNDPAFAEAAAAWAEEEVQHGEALGRWAQLADPDWDFDKAVRDFRAGFKVDVDAPASRRGSRSGELISRCIVETGTSSYYTALADATEEPVLEIVCRKIAADELRHYKLFYDHLKTYAQQENLGLISRLRIALGRIAETEDDELSYAYYAAQGAEGDYDRQANANAYMRRAFRYYKEHHAERVVSMVFKAVGFKPASWVFRAASWAAFRIMQRQTRLRETLAA